MLTLTLQIIDDEASVKQQIVLRLPTLASRALTVTYHNQIATLSEIRQEDERLEELQNRVRTSAIIFGLFLDH